jgi:hypothetical protein
MTFNHPQKGGFLRSRQAESSPSYCNSEDISIKDFLFSGASYHEY